MSARDRRDDRRSTARARAAQRASGFETTMFKMPQGLNFFQLEKGRKRVSVLGFTAGKGNPFAQPGQFHFERTFYCYNKIGADEKRYIAPAKTFNHKDYIAEWRAEKSKDPKFDQEVVKALLPKERQAFLVFDHDEPHKGVQLFEFSFHKFGKLLDTRIQNSDEAKGWDYFYFLDDDGFMLELTIIDTGTYGLEVSAIDFEKRTKPLPENVVNHGICLDDILLELSYDELKARFLCLSDEDREKSSVTSEPRVNKEPERKQEQPEPKKEETKTPFDTAADLGIVRDDEVLHGKRLLTVIRVASDGLTLTLMDPDGDELIKDVPVSSVKKVAIGSGAKAPEGVLSPSPAGSTKPQGKNPDPPFDDDTAAKPKDASSGDADWDSDWN